MNDSAIVDLYWQRSESAISKTKSMLHRTRQGLKVHLTKEGYFHDN